MNIGDYVRTKDGWIYKIEDGEDFYEDSVDVGIGTIPDVDGIWIDKAHFQYVDKREIIKSSPNIIDLIEVGDIIICDNKKYAINYEFEVDYNNDYNDYEITIDDYITLFLKDGLSIVTKEQFESMEYKIESEE